MTYTEKLLITHSFCQKLRLQEHFYNSSNDSEKEETSKYVRCIELTSKLQNHFYTDKTNSKSQETSISTIKNEV